MSKNTITKLNIKNIFSTTTCILFVLMASITAFAKDRHTGHALNKSSVKKIPAKSSIKPAVKAGNKTVKHIPKKPAVAHASVNLKNAHKTSSKVSLRKSEKKKPALRASHKIAVKPSKKTVTRSIASKHSASHHPASQKHIAVASHAVRHPARLKHPVHHSRRMAVLRHHSHHSGIGHKAVHSHYRAVLASKGAHHFHYSPAEYVKRKLQTEMKEYLGVPYRMGGSSFKGMDCSGFSRTIYADVFGITLPHNSAEQFSDPKLHSVNENKLKTGDLIFFSKRKRINHVGIYLGNRRFMHATNGSGITISNLDNRHWKSLVAGTKRLMSFNKKIMLHHRS